MNHIPPTRRRPRAVAAAAAATVAIVSLAGCAQPVADEDTSLTIAIPSWQFTVEWDMIRNVGYNIFLPTQPVYDSLIWWDAKAEEYVPWLAQDFEFSDDLKDFHMELRDDVDFIDGQHLDAQVVADLLNAAFANDDSYMSVLHADLELSAEVTGEYSVTIHSVKPVPINFLVDLASMGISTPASIDDPELLADAPIGTGPYVIDELVPDASITYVRNEAYWNPSAFPYDTVTILVYDDKVAALNALKSGQVDVAEVSPEYADEAESSGLTIATGAGLSMVLTFLDTTGVLVPALGDVRVRQAISHAFDRAAINEAVNRGYGSARSQLYPEGWPEHVEGADDRYAYDPERSKELLAEAGYPDGFTLPLPRIDSAGPYDPLIEQSLADIGIEVDWVEYVDGGALNVEVTAGRVPVTFGTLLESSIMLFLGLRTAPPIENPEWPALLAAYQSPASAEEFEETRVEIGEFLLEEAWHVQVASPEAIWATDPSVTLDLASSIYKWIQLSDIGIGE